LTPPLLRTTGRKAVIAFLLIIYTGAVLLLFKVLRLKPQPYLIAGIIVAGILMLGGVVVGWMQSAQISENLITSQYVVQLVPYVKGQVKTVYAQANTPMKQGDPLLEIVRRLTNTRWTNWRRNSGSRRRASMKRRPGLKRQTPM
jgi:multidrug resistance efflux pump